MPVTETTAFHGSFCYSGYQSALLRGSSKECFLAVSVLRPTSAFQERLFHPLHPYAARSEQTRGPAGYVHVAAHLGWGHPP